MASARPMAYGLAGPRGILPGLAARLRTYKIIGPQILDSGTKNNNDLKIMNS
jgi:hypothetical protein